MSKKEENVKIILLGDSAVGKSKLVERFLLDAFKPQVQSTYGVTLFHHVLMIEGEKIEVDFWDTAGQEQFNNVHPSYYFKAHCCILVFDTTRKQTYQNLEKWYQELLTHRKNIPVLVVANKIDFDMSVTDKSFNFAEKRSLPFFFASAADGTNVVKIFQEAIRLGKIYRENPPADFVDEVLDFLGED